MKAQLMNWALIVLNAAASLGYFVDGNWKKGIYFCAAGVLYLMILLMGE
jgi:hypothetical protein